MLYGKYTSLKTIIAKVYRDLQLKEEEPFMDMIEWGAEALEQIGVFEQLETKQICLDFDFYKAELPCDLVYIDAVDCNGYNLLPTTNSLGPIRIEPYLGAEDSGLSKEVNGDKINNATFYGAYYNNPYASNTYTIENGYIKTGLQEGNLNIIYQALPMDEEGYPLVPDEVSFREAVYRYIVYKTFYPKWIMGQLTDRVMLDAEQKWYWYCGQAGSKAKMPDAAKLESIKTSYLSLKPQVNQFQNFFQYLNQ